MVETVAHYRIQSELGSGGMGVVYRAEDTKLGRHVALKFLAANLADDPLVRTRFLREARAAAALSHPNICTIYEINDAGPRPFIAMELLEGRTLQDLLASGALPATQLLDLAIQIADALAAAHSHGLVHRDIKPGNIYVTSDGRAKVVDFGLAKPVDLAARKSDEAETVLGQNVLVTQSGTTVGTVAYMSPEQARGENVDARSDLFSFGLVLYEMACGRRAFDGNTPAIVFDGVLNRTPLPPSFINPGVPPELEQVISCAIEKDRDRRYQSAASLGDDLRRVRRASDPHVPIADGPFTPSAAGPVSPGWGVTPARGLKTAGERGPASGGAGSRARSGAYTYFAAGLGVVLLAAGGVFWWSSRTPAIAEGARVIIADFVNRTGDPDFDGTLKQALAIKLGESPYLRVVPEQRVREILRLMARKSDEAVTAAIGREICQRIGNGALMTGEVSRMGSSYVVTLGAESCPGGDEIAREQAEAARKEEVLTALGSRVSSIRERLGESLGSIRDHDKPLVEATTSSLGALKSLTLGDQQRAAGSDPDSVPFYERAVEQDAQFALAYARLGTVYSNMGEKERSKRFYEKAYELRERAGDRERLYITTHYYRATGEAAKAREMYELWRRTYPHDYVPVQNLGVIYQEMGEPERALQAFRDAARMEPRSALARQAVADALFSLGRVDEARKAAESQIRDLGDSAPPHLLLYQLDYFSGNRAGMAAHAAKINGTSGELERLGLDYRFATLEGRFRAAAGMVEQFADRARSRGRPELAEVGRAQHVLDRAVVGFTSGTRAEANSLLAGKPSPRNTVTLAFALALAGDIGRSRALAAAAWTGLGSDQFVERITRPALEALTELRQGRPARAVEILKVSEPWESVADAAGIVCMNIRGLAFLSAGDPAAAETQFAKVLSKRGFAAMDLGQIVARVNLARARALAGDSAGARKDYEEFFRLWKNADPDVPLLKQVKDEYDRLPKGS